MLEFFKAPILALHFSCYTLMPFLMMLFVILLSMLMILLSILSVIRHLICGNNLNWLLNLNLIYETLWTGVRSGLLISILGKLNWFCLTSPITMVLLVLSRKNHLLRCWAWPEVALYLYKCTICPCMGYCCPVWAGAPSSYLELLDKLLKRICRTVGPSLAVSLEALAHCQNVASLSLFYRYHFGRSSSTDWLNWFYFLFLKGGLLVILTDCMIFLFSLAWSESQSKKPF